MTKQKALWVMCEGEAHTNPYIDNCFSCIPFWAKYPTCPFCFEEVRGRQYHKMLTEKGYCKNCKKHYDLDKTPLVITKA